MDQRLEITHAGDALSTAFTWIISKYIDYLCKQVQSGTWSSANKSQYDNILRNYANPTIYYKEYFECTLEKISKELMIT